MLSYDKEKTFCVYVIQNSVNGKLYVGKTFSPNSRWYKHKWEAKNGSEVYLARAIRKHGENAFTFEVLELCESEEQALEYETEWIEWLGTRAPRGYNLSNGGEGQTGYVPSAETRRKISESSKGKNLGKPRSQETKDKVSVGLRKYFAENGSPLFGRERSAEHSANISKAKTGKPGQPWASGRDVTHGVFMTRWWNDRRLAAKYPGIFDLEIDEQ